MGLTQAIAELAVQFIQSTGYASVFILMIMESMVLPMPSEAVMPFAGWLISTGHFNWPLVVLVSTLGSIVGSLLSYAAGYYGGKPFIRKFGKYVFLNEHHLNATHRFFNQRGAVTILICRFIPVVRHLISIPAGFAKMNIWLFSGLTILGAGLWNSFLALVGTILQAHWDTVLKYSHIIDYAIVAILAGVVVWFFVRQIRKARQAGADGGS
jgi:membrane protein DedA with SNARE-associated domain